MTKKRVNETTPIIPGTRWMKDAACAGVSTDIFFTELDELPGPDAQALCRICPVKADCLQWALTMDVEGYWGETTRAQRDALLSGRTRVKCPLCGSHSIADLGNATCCIDCGVSW